jgi:hypothetical protein
MSTQVCLLNLVDIDNHYQFLFIYLQEEMGGGNDGGGYEKKVGDARPNF